MGFGRKPRGRGTLLQSNLDTKLGRHDLDRGDLDGLITLAQTL